MKFILKHACAQIGEHLVLQEALETTVFIVDVGVVLVANIGQGTA
jgi:hypothetical protein